MGQKLRHHRAHDRAADLRNAHTVCAGGSGAIWLRTAGSTRFQGILASVLSPLPPFSVTTARGEIKNGIQGPRK